MFSDTPKYDKIKIKADDKHEIPAKKLIALLIENLFYINKLIKLARISAIPIVN